METPTANTEMVKQLSRRFGRYAAAIVIAGAGAFAAMVFCAFVGLPILPWIFEHSDVPHFYIFTIHYFFISLLAGFAGVLSGTLSLERSKRHTGSVIIFVVGLAFYAALRMPMQGAYLGCLESLLPFTIGGSVVVVFFTFRPLAPTPGLKQKWPLAIVSMIIFAVGVVGWLNRPTQENVIRNVFGSQQCYDAFVNSQVVTAQRLLRHEGSDPRELSNYDHEAPVSVTDAQAQEIKHLLVKPSSYEWSRARKTCGINYDVLFTFRSGSRAMRVAFYLQCDILYVFDGENESAHPVNLEEDYDLIRKPLVAIVKSVFPDDPDIRKLK
jgi:hypothetical protein